MQDSPFIVQKGGQTSRTAGDSGNCPLPWAWFRVIHDPAVHCEEGITMPFTFEGLNVYRRALKVAETVSGMAAAFGRSHYLLADELRRGSCHFCDEKTGTGERK